MVIELGHPAEHLAGRDLHRPPVAVIGVVDDLGGRVGRPRHYRKRREVGIEQDVLVGGIVLEGLVVVGIFAGDRLGEQRARQGHRRAGKELSDRHHLAAADAGLVGHDAFDVLDAPRRQPFAGRFDGRDAARQFGRLYRLFLPRQGLIAPFRAPKALISALMEPHPPAGIVPDHQRGGQSPPELDAFTSRRASPSQGPRHSFRVRAFPVVRSAA